MVCRGDELKKIGSEARLVDEIVCRRLAKGGYLAEIDHEADFVSEVGV